MAEGAAALALGLLVGCADVAAPAELPDQEPLAQQASGRNARNRQGTLPRALAELRSRRRVYGPTDSLVDYAKKCDQATGITVPKFSCMTGSTIPGQGTVAAYSARPGQCAKPNVLNGECDPGSRFQVLPGGTADAVAVAHCRKDGNEEAGTKFGDIAVIQYNKRNGAVCFYQALSDWVAPGELEGSEVPAPGDPTSKWPWISPDETQGIGCSGCHNSGGFIRSGYLAQKLNPSPSGTVFALPTTAQGFNNKTTPLRWVGLDYQDDVSWSITLAGPGGSPCTSCHNLGVSLPEYYVSTGGSGNGGANSGTAASIARNATIESLDERLPGTPPWMPPGASRFSQANFDIALRYEACAKMFALKRVDPNNPEVKIPDECRFTELGKKW